MRINFVVVIFLIGLIFEESLQDEIIEDRYDDVPHVLNEAQYDEIETVHEVIPKIETEIVPEETIPEVVTEVATDVVPDEVPIVVSEIGNEVVHDFITDDVHDNNDENESHLNKIDIEVSSHFEERYINPIIEHVEEQILDDANHQQDDQLNEHLNVEITNSAIYNDIHQAEAVQSEDKPTDEKDNDHNLNQQPAQEEISRHIIEEQRILENNESDLNIAIESNNAQQQQEQEIEHRREANENPIYDAPHEHNHYSDYSFSNNEDVDVDQEPVQDQVNDYSNVNNNTENQQNPNQYDNNLDADTDSDDEANIESALNSINEVQSHHHPDNKEASKNDNDNNKEIKIEEYRNFDDLVNELEGQEAIEQNVNLKQDELKHNQDPTVANATESVTENIITTTFLFYTTSIYSYIYETNEFIKSNFPNPYKYLIYIIIGYFIAYVLSIVLSYILIPIFRIFKSNSNTQKTQDNRKLEETVKMVDDIIREMRTTSDYLSNKLSELTKKITNTIDNEKTLGIKNQKLLDLICSQQIETRQII